MTTRIKLLASAVAVIVGVALSAAVVVSDRKERPSELPPRVGFQGAIYEFDGAGQLPDGADRVGTTRGGGILYGPAQADERASDVWVTFRGKTWRYEFQAQVD